MHFAGYNNNRKLTSQSVNFRTKGVKISKVFFSYQIVLRLR